MVTLEATKNKTIRQHNLVNAARYEFSVVEKRIIYLIIEKLNGVEKEEIEKAVTDDGLKLRINYKPVLQVSELWSENANKNHKYIKDAAKNLLSRQYEFDGVTVEEGKEEPITDGFNLISQYRIFHHKTIIQIQVPKLALPYFTQLARNYTNYNLFNAMTLQSQFSQRLYELCNQYKDTGWFVMHIDQLKSSLNISDGYTITKIKTQILDIAKKELYAKTELSFAYTERKEGKKVVRFDFKVFFNTSKNEELSRKINTEEAINIMSSKLQELGLSQYQASIAAQNIPYANFNKLVHDFQLKKPGLSNPSGWLVAVIERSYNCSLSPVKNAAA